MKPFNRVNEADLAFFESILPGRVFSGEAISTDYDHDEMTIYGHYAPEAVLQAQSTEEISAVLRYCNGRNIAVTPRGAGTGLCGGCVATEGGVVLSTERMKRVLEVDTRNMTATVEPGVLLFDEPLANLDPATGKKAIALIDRIQKEQKKTIVIIEHRLEDVLYKDVDRIVVVGEGTIVADMKPDDLLAGNILKEQGIREPLYVTALKHAGCTIAAEDHPQHVETMNFEPYRAQVREWFETTKIPQKQEAEEKVLNVDHLHFSYQPGKAILSDISFDVKKGEMISIVGKNGAGKTTLSNLICGFLEPSNGKIELNGKDISPLSVKERGEHIGIVMQNPNQMLSKPMIYEEVALGLTVRGVPEEEIRERVYETLKICGLYQFRNWPVSALSFGQKKRVTIASILVMKPEILILDEPTAGQDYRHYTEIMEFLKTINETQGTTIIMITHDMHLMLEYTNRAIVVADGQLLTIDTPAKVLTDETITAPAYLKQTSLYEMAVKCGIEDPSQFVQRFINYERAVR